MPHGHNPESHPNHDSSPANGPSASHRQLSRRGFLLGGTAAAGIGLIAYAGSHARHELEVVPRTIAIANLPDAFQNFRIVQFSDIHLEEFTQASFLERIVNRINALQPDLLLITGDFISRGPRHRSVALRAAGLCGEILSRLTCPQRFAVLGNHDVYVGAWQVKQSIEAGRLPVLVDSFVPIERGGDRIWLSGARDPSTLGSNLYKAIPADPRAPVIYMAHEPDFADYVVRHPRFPLIDLMLSGHSHGGQVRLPWIGPLILPPMGQKYVEGLFHFGHMQLYVNRGVGTVEVPFRLNCSPELTHITLVRA